MSRNRVLIVTFAIAAILMASLSDCHLVTEEGDAGANDTVPLTKYWEKAIPHQNIPEGLTSLSAKDCGNCHKDIYEEWQQSTHAIAWQDLQFQAEWRSSGVYACLNCHIPLQNQQEYIVTALINGDHKTPVQEPNPHFDKDLQSESITCASCHVRNGSVIGTSENTKAPHKTVQDVEFLSERICISCHNAVDQLNPILVCTFETGDEWVNNWAVKEGKNCISCHMLETEHEIFPGMGVRKSHFHYFPGSGIPKLYGRKTHGLNGMEIFEDTIGSIFAVGENLTYRLKVQNSYAGHNIPTGDPERFFRIEFKVMDIDSNVLATSEHRIGEMWEWYPEAKKLEDNNLKPREDREFVFKYDLLKQGDYTLIAEVTKHRMSRENAEYNGILEEYPIYISTWKREYAITVE